MTMTGDDNSTCAACGKSSGNLKACTACKLVKYCNRDCQVSHRRRHKKECKIRAAELFDEKLFADPPPREKCPACNLLLPCKVQGCEYQSCCGKMVCAGCIAAHSMGAEKLCPSCGVQRSRFTSNEEHVSRLRKRIDAKDGNACCVLGQFYSEGSFGLPQDENTEMELHMQGGDLGSPLAYFNIAFAYEHGGSGVKKDMKKAWRYYSLSAMGGRVEGRAMLAEMEYKEGNMLRSMKHSFIAARAGHDECMEVVRQGLMEFKPPIVTKDQYERTLEAWKGAVNEMQSEERDLADESRRQRKQLLSSFSGGQLVMPINRMSGKEPRQNEAMQFLDEPLFQDPPPKEECPICYLPLPNSVSQSQYQPCCGKILCSGCIIAVIQEDSQEGKCPFCRKPGGISHQEDVDRLIRLIEDKSDPEAMFTLGSSYENGMLGLPQNIDRAMELYFRAGRLGSVSANSRLGSIFCHGENEIQKDLQRANDHLRLAAMAGDVRAREMLGLIEANADAREKFPFGQFNKRKREHMHRAMKHWMIAAHAGDDLSLEKLKMGFKDGFITKVQLADAYRAWFHANDEMKSEQRDRAFEVLQRKIHGE